VPVIADVSDGTARAGESPLSVPPAIPRDSLDGRLAVPLTEPLAELDQEDRGRVRSHVEHGGARWQ